MGCTVTTLKNQILIVNVKNMIKPVMRVYFLNKNQLLRINIKNNMRKLVIRIYILSKGCT